jgi:hypothetical protein
MSILLFINHIVKYTLVVLYIQTSLVINVIQRYTKNQTVLVFFGVDWILEFLLFGEGDMSFTHSLSPNKASF